MIFTEGIIIITYNIFLAPYIISAYELAIWPGKTNLLFIILIIDI